MPNNQKVLDVENDEQRHNRLCRLLTRLNDSSSTLVAPNLKIGDGSTPGPTELPTELLERIRAFLPAISASNEALSEMRPEDIDIENVQEDEEQYIEMNLGLGVFEAKHHTPPSSDGGSSAESSSESEIDSEYSRSGSEEDSSSDDDDSDSESGSSVDMKPIFSRPIKPLPRRVSGKTRIPVA